MAPQLHGSCRQVRQHCQAWKRPPSGRPAPCPPPGVYRAAHQAWQLRRGGSGCPGHPQPYVGALHVALHVLQISHGSTVDQWCLCRGGAARSRQYSPLPSRGRSPGRRSSVSLSPVRRGSRTPPRRPVSRSPDRSPPPAKRARSPLRSRSPVRRRCCLVRCCCERLSVCVWYGAKPALGPAAAACRGLMQARFVQAVSGRSC